MIRQFLDLSTAHVSLAARVWLNEQAALNHEDGAHPRCWHVASHVHGWWMHAGASDEVTDMEGVPIDLWPVCTYARANDCYFILFDKDGDQIGGLPVYDWENEA